MSDEKRVMEMNRMEYEIILNSLINMKNELHKQEKETDLIDKVIRKTIKSPSKQKNGIFHKKNDNRYEER